MKILRYFNREVLLHTFAISAVLLGIVFSVRFSKFLAQAAAGDLAVGVLLPVMFYRVPGFLEMIIPLAMFIGILMAYGRMYVDSEMVVMGACGISPRKMALYTLVPALIITGVVAALTLYITPLGAARAQALLEDPKSTQGLSTLTAGRFQSRAGGRIVSYTADIDSAAGVMENVFIAQQVVDSEGQRKMRVTLADTGSFVTLPKAGVRYFELHDGHSYEGKPGRLDFRVTRFERFGELIPEIPDGIRDTDPVNGRPTRALINSAALEDQAALQWRLSLPIMVSITAVIALCLSRTEPRRGRYFKLLPALLIFLVYLMGLIKGRAALENGELPLATGLWWVHLLFACLALLLLYLPDRQHQRSRRNKRGDHASA